MKKFYLFTFLFISSLSPSAEIIAQCTCSDGSTPDSVSYSQYFDSIITTNTLISFPQFNPDSGTLQCIRLSDTVTTVVSYNLQNDLNYQETYNFETFRRSQFTGPGSYINSVTSAPMDYGPYVLEAKDSVGDNVEIGPDTVFNKKYQSKYGSSDPAYYGTGTVNFNYLTTSTFTILTGSDNAIFKLRAYTRLFVMLTYYWCPSSILANQISDFDAAVDGGNVILDWNTGTNENASYEVEYSSNGISFRSLGNGVPGSSESIKDFSFQFKPDKFSSGNYFFRIKRTDKTGKVYYSNVKMLGINHRPVLNYRIYPNPVIDVLNIQFPNSSGSQYLVWMINSMGQQIFTKSYTNASSGAVNISLPQGLSPGIYFLKVKDMVSNKEETAKVLVSK